MFVGSISPHSPNLGVWFGSILNCDVCSVLPSAILGAAICDYCEHDEYALAKFVVKILSFQSVNQLDLKLAHDALEELAVFNSCEYN